MKSIAGFGRSSACHWKLSANLLLVPFCRPVPPGGQPEESIGPQQRPVSRRQVRLADDPRPLAGRRSSAVRNGRLGADAATAAAESAATAAASSEAATAAAAAAAASVQLRLRHLVAIQQLGKSVQPRGLVAVADEQRRKQNLKTGRRVLIDFSLRCHSIHSSQVLS